MQARLTSSHKDRRRLCETSSLQVQRILLTTQQCSYYRRSKLLFQLILLGAFTVVASFTLKMSDFERAAKKPRSEGPEEPKKLSLETQLVSYNACPNDPHGATSMPIYQSATFKQPSATEFGAYDYTRSGNPTRDALQDQVASLEGSEGAKATCFTSGMAALAAVVKLAKNGEEIIANDDSYGGTYRLLSQICVSLGVIVTYIDMSSEGGPQALKDAISAKTKLVMIESPTNPIHRVCNIRELAKICHENNHPGGTLLSIDNTMMSPILQRPLELGADIVVHSLTKFYSGHADAMAGAVICKDKKEGAKTLHEAVYFFLNAEGSGLAPFDCWLILRGMKTMAIRIEKQLANAMAVAKWLQTVPQVKHVYYSSLPDHPDYKLHMSQASGGGSVVSFETGDFELSKHIVTVTKLFKITVSFGSVSSVIELPGLMSHASIPAEVRNTREFPEDIIRLSVGIESAQDLIDDLQHAFDTFKK